MRTLLTPDDAARGLRRVAGEIIERHRGVDKLLLVGIRRGGVALAERLAEELSQSEGKQVPVGYVDITLYRDDAAEALPNPRIGPTNIPIELRGYRVVLCDDVLFTGRTVRAAVDALMDYGRPARVELAVIVERDGRELPIQADYVVRKVDVSPNERVDVIFQAAATSGSTVGGQFTAVAVAQGTPTTPPPAAMETAP